MARPARQLSPEGLYRRLEGLPEHLVGEILAGELHVHPRPAPRHALAYSALGASLGPLAFGEGGGPGGWWILDEPELHLGAEVLVPDLAGWRRERLPALPDTAWFELAPDWVCEILSPSTATVDRGLKLGIYAREGVGHLWLVDPDARTLEVFRLGGDGHWVLLEVLSGDAEVRQPPFEALSFPLGRLWPPQPPSEETPGEEAPEEAAEGAAGERPEEAAPAGQGGEGPQEDRGRQASGGQGTEEGAPGAG
ncbi:MAG: Uma2 family endonuclease [Gammaproteobacteria bacterium]|nr:MAG: Uma2 family endonuclease [Gammaproteobacteria bacterium]